MSQFILILFLIGTLIILYPKMVIGLFVLRMIFLLFCFVGVVCQETANAVFSNELFVNGDNLDIDTA